MQNRARHLVAMLHEVCAAEGIDLVSFCEDWVHRLERNGRTAFVFGYDFSINNATAQSIAKDKAATYAVLSLAGIPAVEHRLFFAPSMAAYIPHDGNWASMAKYLEAHPGGIVGKPNEGTGGNDVYRISTMLQLETAVQRLFQRHRTVCFSPFLDQASEFRVIVVDDASVLAYEKVRPTVVGNGRSTVRELFLQHPAVSHLGSAGIGDLLADPAGCDAVPQLGYPVLLNWRHNLGQGATPRILSEADSRFESLDRLARSAAAALGLRASSIDILEAAEGRAAALEVNAGIMMEHLATSSEQMRALAKSIYHRIVLLMLSG